MSELTNGIEPLPKRRRGLRRWLAKMWRFRWYSRPLRRALFRRDIALRRGLKALWLELLDERQAIEEQAYHALESLQQTIDSFRSDEANRDTALHQEVEALRPRLELMRQDVESLRAESANRAAALRQEVESLRTEAVNRDTALRQETGALRAEAVNRDAMLRQETKALRSECESLRRSVQSYEANLDNGIGSLRQEFSQLSAALARAERTLAELPPGLLLQRTALWELGGSTAPAHPKGRVRQVAGAKGLKESLAELKARYPRTTKLWRELLAANDAAYKGTPTDSCSVAGHKVAEYFHRFLLPYLRGRVLDVGCGPQSEPAYLRGYPSDLVYGLDPIAPFHGHPFEFFRGVAEFNPWPDNSFDVVVAATSLDHVLSLDMTMAEIHRVLKPDGVFVVWQSIVPGAAPYDPADKKLTPLDQFHLFHFSPDFFEQTLGGLFTTKEKLPFDGESYFYCLAPKA